MLHKQAQFFFCVSMLVTNVLSAVTITMSIYPNSSLSFSPRPGLSPINGLFLAVLEGVEPQDIIFKKIHKDTVHWASSIEQRYNGIPLFLFKGLSKNYDDLIVRICCNDSNKFRTINLPPIVKERFLKYLHNGMLNDDSDCGDFVKRLNFGSEGWPYMVDLAAIVFDSREVLAPEACRCEQTLFFCSNVGEDPHVETNTKIINHFAFALDDDLYLSKFNKNGALWVSSRQALLDYYSSQHAMIVTYNGEDRLFKISLLHVYFNITSKIVFPFMAVIAIYVLLTRQV